MYSLFSFSYTIHICYSFIRPLLALFGGMGAGCFSTFGNNLFGNYNIIVKYELALLYSTKLNSIIFCRCGKDKDAREWRQAVQEHSRLLRTNRPCRRRGRTLQGYCASLWTRGIIFMSFETIQVLYWRCILYR